MRLGTQPVTKFYRKSFYHRLVKGLFEEGAKVIVVSVGQIAAAGIYNE